MEIDKNGIDLLQNSVNRPVMQVQETKGAPVTRLSFDVGDVKHLRHIQDIGIQVDSVHTVSHLLREVPQICIANVFFDFNVKGYPLDSGSPN